MKYINPHITEKSVILAKKNQFSLEVSQDLNKYEIKKLVKRLFKVEPKKILVINGKNRKFMTMRKQEKTNRGIKKAIVVLQKGEILSGFEAYLEDEKKKKEPAQKGKKI